MTFLGLLAPLTLQEEGLDPTSWDAWFSWGRCLEYSHLLSLFVLQAQVKPPLFKS